MKRLVITAAALFIASIFTYGQSGETPRSREDKEVREVRAAFGELVGAARRRDRAAYERLLVDGFTFVHATGAAETRAEYIEHAVTGGQLFQRADSEVLDEGINVYGGDTAVWTSRTRWRSRADGSETVLRSTNVFVNPNHELESC